MGNSLFFQAKNYYKQNEKAECRKVEAN